MHGGEKDPAGESHGTVVVDRNEKGEMKEHDKKEDCLFMVVDHFNEKEKKNVAGGGGERDSTWLEGSCGCVEG